MEGRSGELGAIFSCPGSDQRAALLEQAQTSDARDYIHGFLRRRADELERRSSGVTAMLERVLDGPAPRGLGLAFPWQSVIASFSADEPDAALVGAKIAGHLYGCGQRATWAARFARPRALRIDRCITPKVVALEVEGDSIELETTTGSLRTNLAHGEGLRALGLVQISAEEKIWVAGAEDDDALSLNHEYPFTQAPLEHRVQELAAAVQLTREVAPEYVPWFAGAIRIVASLEGVGGSGSLRSSSPQAERGVVYISSPLEVCRVAESLIHEASHQHFQALHTAAELMVASAEERVYMSPYKHENRTIDRILFAAHAFANVIAFYERALRVVKDEAVIMRAEQALALHRHNHVIQKKYLEESDELTEAGRALYRTIDATLEPWDNSMHSGGRAWRTA